MTGLTLHTRPQSRGRVAHWMMEELDDGRTGERQDTVWLDGDNPMKTPDCWAVNPMGKVPALRHGRMVATEAAAGSPRGLCLAGPDMGCAHQSSGQT